MAIIKKKHHNISCLRNDPGPGWVVKAHPVFLGDGNRNRHTQRNNPHPGDTTLPYSWDWSPWAVSTRRKTCRKSFCPFKKGKNQEIQYITSIVLLASMASWSWFWRHIRTSPLRTTPNAIAKNQQLPQIRTRNTFIIKFQTRKNKKWIKLPTKLESSCYFQSLHVPTVPRSIFFPNKKKYGSPSSSAEKNKSTTPFFPWISPLAVSAPSRRSKTSTTWKTRIGQFV